MEDAHEKRKIRRVQSGGEKMSEEVIEIPPTDHEGPVYVEKSDIEIPLFRVSNQFGEEIHDGLTLTEFKDYVRDEGLDPQVVRTLLLGVIKDEEE